TEEGIAKMERWSGVPNIYDLEHVVEAHQINQALKAKALYLRDRDYLIKDAKVVIVDEFTGRLMPGRRWSDGLHQAVEAKEGLKVEQEQKTMATITLQNYFRLYEKLAGMTGTALTEAEEFHKLYGLEVAIIPTNMAGRGTDIVRGEGVREVGGLHIIGTERHESRRIDNQLRGRSGRQGDPGSSRFFISLEDDLMKKFGPAADRIGSMMERL